MKLLWLSSWPRIGSPCLARNLMLRRMVNICCLLWVFSSEWADERTSPMSLVSLGSFNFLSTASLWQSESWCFRNFEVASFQLQNPVDRKLPSILEFDIFPSFAAAMQVKQKARSFAINKENLLLSYWMKNENVLLNIASSAIGFVNKICCVIFQKNYRLQDCYNWNWWLSMQCVRYTKSALIGPYLYLYICLQKSTLVHTYTCTYVYKKVTSL